MARWGRVIRARNRYAFLLGARLQFHFGPGLPTEETEFRDILANGLIRATEARKSHHLLKNRIDSLRRREVPKEVLNFRDPIDVIQNIADFCYTYLTWDRPHVQNR